MADLTNDCDIITIFPLTVGCVTTDPSTFSSADGSISLNINGGTPPYDIQWTNGATGTNLGNLVGGDYEVVVMDSYGDFIIKHTCTLVQPEPVVTRVPNITTTTTISPNRNTNFCLTRYYMTSYDDFFFEPAGIVDGHRSWSSSTLTIQYDENRNRWEMYGYTVPPGYSAGITISYDPPTANPPLNWSVGGSDYNYLVSVTLGECPDRDAPQGWETNDASDPYDNDGSFIITGTDPTQRFSLNGGPLSSSPIFNGLSAGTHTITILDVNTGNEEVKTITIGAKRTF